MEFKFIYITLALLFFLIVFGPWLALTINPAIIYFLDIFVLIVLIFMAFSITNKAKKEQDSKEIITLAAHQLSSPLISLKWALDMLLEGNFGETSNEQKSVLKKAAEKNSWLIELVEDLLVQEDKIISLNDIVSSVIKYYEDEINKKKIDFKFIKTDKTFPQMNINGQKLKFIIQNLFDNAIKYTPPGGKIIASFRMCGKFLEFKIEDSGIGIKKENQKNIFKKFFRGAEAKKEEPIGHGLGLFFVKKIIESSGGKIWFNSKEKAGSTFYFSLPIRR